MDRKLGSSPVYTLCLQPLRLSSRTLRPLREKDLLAPGNLPLDMDEPAVDLLVTGGAGVLAGDHRLEFLHVLAQGPDLRVDPFEHHDHPEDKRRCPESEKIDHLHMHASFF